MTEALVDTRYEPLKHAGDPVRFRAEVRGWLETRSRGWTDRMTDVTEDEYAAFQKEWFQELSSVGLATAHWPLQWGGAGLSHQNQVIINEEVARTGAPRPSLYTISLNHVPATLFAFGTQDQRDRYVKGVQESGEIWCQGFSEPNAGSDLASLRTRAARQGDVYVVSGQKIWSSMAMHARYCLLLARTDFEAKKHAGISYFILDLESPGVTVRPIRQATGRSEFCEIFLDEVEIPVANLIGEENEGWKVAQSTLSAERGLMIFELSERLMKDMNRQLADGRRSRAAWLADDELRRDFMEHYAAMLALRRMVASMLAEVEANPEMGASLAPVYIKLHFAVLIHAYTAFLVKVDGLDAQYRHPEIFGGGQHTGNRMIDYIWSYAWTISGGTNEIMRNIISERGLGLPR